MPINVTTGFTVAGVKIKDHIFSGRMVLDQLLTATLNPLDAENKRKVAESESLARLAGLRRDAQRVFEGAKRKNAPAYAEYLKKVNVNSAENNGMSPAIILFTPKELPVEVRDKDFGFTLLQVPFGTTVMAIDGETQLAAWHLFRAQHPEELENASDIWVAVMVAHGKSIGWARQAFHDLNILGVKPNPALSLGMDGRDRVTRIARGLESHIPFLHKRVNTSRRQLRKADDDVITITALRGACVTLLKGISGVQYGAKPVPNLSVEHLDDYEKVAREWFGALIERFGPALENRELTILYAPSVWSALGALGHDLLHVDAATRAARIAQTVDGLMAVNWSKGEHWNGVAGKISPKTGRLSVGGSKETAYAIYGALSDTTNMAYRQIRRGANREDGAR